MTRWNLQNPALKNIQGVEIGCFRHRNTDFGHTNLACSNLIFGNTETTVKHNSSFFYQTRSERNNQKIENKYNV